MKVSLALGQRVPLSRQTAWGCFTTNLALPGFGSLMAGHKIGYAQVVLGQLGMVLTTIFGVRFILWYFREGREFLAQADTLEGFSAMWGAVHWALVGMAIFFIGCTWALISSLIILREAKLHELKANRSSAPPLASPPKIQ